MIPNEVAQLLEGYASQVIELPGVSRTNPHAFAEAKSELAGDMRALASRLRTIVRQADARAASKPGAIVPGTRLIDKREVRVERRRVGRSAQSFRSL